MNFLHDAQFQEQPLSILSTYDSLSTTTGSLLTAGGLGVKLSAHIGEFLTVNSVNVTPSLGDIIYERQDTLQNDISTPEPIANFVFYNNKTQSFNAIISIDVINSVNSALNKTALLEIKGTLNPSGWTLNNRFTGDITNVKFFIQNTIINGVNAGQMYYTNGNLKGTTTTIRFKANTISPTGASNDAGNYSSVPTTLEASGVEYTVTNIGDWASSPTNMQQAIDNLASDLKNISFENELYVSKNGNDTYGNGSINAPFLTVSAALTQVNLYADNVPVVINILPGSYSENLTIVKPNIYLKGSAIGPTKIVRINGTCIINPRGSTGGMYANYYTFENIALIGSADKVLEYTGNHTGSLYIKDCLIYTSNPNMKGLVFTNTTSMKVTISKCDINIDSSANQNTIYTEAGSAVIGSVNNCNIYGRVAATISINGSSNFTFNYCYIDNIGTAEVIELKNTVVAFFTNCTISNSQTNSNGIKISTATNLVLSHCIFNIPTDVAYNPLNPSSTPPPATPSNYAIKGPASAGSSIVYGACLFAPVTVIGANYYWGSKAVSNTVNIVPYNTALASQA